MTSTERSRTFKASQEAKGLVQCNVWIPRQAVAEFKLAAAKIALNPDLRLGRMVNEKTGRIEGLN